MHQLIAISPAAAQGEIIAPNDCIEVVSSLNKFGASRQVIRLPAGSTLAECVDAAKHAYDGPVPAAIGVQLGDELIDERFWHRVRVKKGAFVGVHGVPGGGDILRNILLVVVAIAALAASIFLPGLGIPVFAASLIALGIGVGGTFAVNALFPVRPPVLDSKGRPSQTYSISGGSNSAAPFDPIPFTLGTHRVFPNLAARSYTESDGEKQTLIMLFCWGYGPLAVSDLRIGETPLEQFEDVQIEHDFDFNSGSETISLFPNEVIEDQLSIQLEHEDPQIRTTAAGVTKIAVDFALPSGLYKLNTENGNYSKQKVRVEVKYRLIGDTAWKSFAALLEVEKANSKPRRYTREQVVAEGQYDVEVRKTSGDSDEDGNTIIVSDIFWTSLRSYRTDPPIEFDKSLGVTALRIKATGQLSGVISAFNGVVNSKQLSFNGTNWNSAQFSENPANLFRYVLQGPFNPRPVPDAKIDIARIEDWWSYCDAQGFTFNMHRDFRVSVWDCLSDVAAAGRAIPCFVDGKWSVVYDDPDAPIAGHFTPRNSRGFTEERAYVRAPHAYRVRFVNRDILNAGDRADYKEDERFVFDDGYSEENATLYEQMQFPGITTADLAWRHGRFHIAQQRLRPSLYSLIVAREHFRNTVGDRVLVQHYLPMWGLVSGRVKSVAGSVITLDEFVTMEVGKTYSIRFTRAGGDVSFTRDVQTDATTTKEITLIGSGSAPLADDLFSFGETAMETVTLRIKKIRPLDEHEARLELLDDAPAISEADQGSIPAFTSNITVPPTPQQLAPIGFSVREIAAVVISPSVASVSIAWQIQQPPTGSLSVPLAATIIQAKAPEDPAEEWETVARVEPPNTSASITIAPGVYVFRARNLFQDGRVSAWVYTSEVSVIGPSKIPGTPQNFLGAVTADLIRLEWQAPALSTTSPSTVSSPYAYRIKFAPVTPSLPQPEQLWSAATIVAENIQALSILVPAEVGTYLIKAVSIDGVESAEAAFFVNTTEGMVDLVEVASENEDPGWTGTHQSTFEDDTFLKLEEEGGVLDWPEILSITAEHWTTVFPEQGIYTADGEIDLGAVYTTRIAAFLDAAGENVSNFIGNWGPIGAFGLVGGDNANFWQAYYEERHTNDDPGGSPVWSAWARITLAQDYTFRAVQRRVVLKSLAPNIRPIVNVASFGLKMPNTLRADNGLTISEDGMRVSYDPAFFSFSGLGASAEVQDDGVRFLTSNQDEEGFDITAKDPSDSFVAGQSFGFNAKGVGARVAA